MRPRQAAAVAMLAALCACHLWDQNTFQPLPGPLPAAPAPPRPEPPVDPRTPLLTVDFATSTPAYTSELAYALDQVQQHRPGADFDVISVVPASGDPTMQALAAKRGSDDALQVMRAMIALGVGDSRIHLGARVVPGLSQRQVRVYLR